jgi:hypothetical protein
VSTRANLVVIPLRPKLPKVARPQADSNREEADPDHEARRVEAADVLWNVHPGLSQLNQDFNPQVLSGVFFHPGLSQLNQNFIPRRVESADVLWNDLVKTLATLPALLAKARAKVAQSSGIKDTATSVSLEDTPTGAGGSRRGGSGIKDGKLLMIYIYNFHVLSHLLLIYMCKLHWNLNRNQGRRKGLGEQ